MTHNVNAYVGNQQAEPKQRSKHSTLPAAQTSKPQGGLRVTKETGPYIVLDELACHLRAWASFQTDRIGSNSSTVVELPV